MLLRHRLLPAAVAGTLLLGSCAGYRGGWESVAYVGDTAPTLAADRTPYEARQRNELNLAGLTLNVNLLNQLRTYDTQVYFFVVPLSVDPRNVQSRPEGPGKTRVSISVSNMTADLVFRPRLARLTVGDRVVEASMGYEYAMWDAGGQRVETGGKWDSRDAGDEWRLPLRGKAYQLSIVFPVDTPSPETRGIALDLSKALAAPELPPIPPIRFAPVRWKEGYT